MKAGSGRLLRACHLGALQSRLHSLQGHGYLWRSCRLGCAFAGSLLGLRPILGAGTSAVCGCCRLDSSGGSALRPGLRQLLLLDAAILLAAWVQQPKELNNTSCCIACATGTSATYVK